MSEPAAKKARTEEAEPKEEEKAPEPSEPEEACELEEDAPADKAPKIKEKVVFNVHDTTPNVLQSSVGNMLMPLTEGALQYLLSGARANVGVKSGRYMFEVQVVEVMDLNDDASARTKVPGPRAQLRVGFAAAGSSLIVGETEDSICFDIDGALVHNKGKTHRVGQKFGSGDVVAVVLNLDSSSPNANTVSLFKNGVRVSKPQALPEALKGKVLHPAVTFRSLSLHYNFGPVVLRPLPFKCKCIQEAAAKEAAVAAAPAGSKTGEVVFPVALPDEGTFDWLDGWLEQHPDYVELSDRAIIAWAEMSGIARSKTPAVTGVASRNSNDKPDFGFGLQPLDDHSIRKVLQSACQLQGRNCVVMEVKANLLKEDRTVAASRWASSGLKRIALVVMGEPPAAFKARSQKLMLKEKQEAANIEFRAKQEEERKKKELAEKKKKLEKAKAEAMKKQKQKAAELKRKLEIEKRKKAAEAQGQEYDPDDDVEMMAPVEEEEEEKAEEEEEEAEQMDEEPPEVELTAEEKKMTFRKKPLPDLSAFALGTSFQKFTVPEKADGFDEVRFEWDKEAKCKEYIHYWVQEKKNTTRVEDIVPGQWFTDQWKDWQKTLSAWHAKQNGYKAMLAKRAADKAAKEAAKRAKAEAKVRKAAAKKLAEELKAKKKAELEKKKAAEAAAKAAAGGEEEQKEGEEEDEEKEAEPEEEAEEEEDEEEEDTKEAEELKKVDLEKVDLFGLSDVVDLEDSGMPLFFTFGFEDWSMMSLRFEMHLLSHAFKKDVKDPDRAGMTVEHLPFYYGKYFKKALNHKFYGVESVADLLGLLKDTVFVNKKLKVVESRLPEQLENWNIFAMLTDEIRRDRLRRIELGDESAKLKLQSPGMPHLNSGSSTGSGASAPGAFPAGPRPVQAPPRPVMAKQGGYRPPMPPAARPSWRGPSGMPVWRG